MIPCSLRSLLVAVFILGNFITWTAARRHLIHNTLGHRSRHRRPATGIDLAPDCSHYKAECDRLSCSVRTVIEPTGDGCKSCRCFSQELDCKAELKECNALTCSYGFDYIDADNGCLRCKCKDPCAEITCLKDEKCEPVEDYGTCVKAEAAKTTGTTSTRAVDTTTTTIRPTQLKTESLTEPVLVVNSTTEAAMTSGITSTRAVETTTTTIRPTQLMTESLTEPALVVNSTTEAAMTSGITSTRAVETTTTTNRPTGIQLKTESPTVPVLVVNSTTEATMTSGITSTHAVETTTTSIRPTQLKTESLTEPVLLVVNSTTEAAMTSGITSTRAVETTTTTNRPTGIQPKTESLTEPVLVVNSTTEAATTSGITSTRAVETTTTTNRPTGIRPKTESLTEPVLVVNSTTEATMTSGITSTHAVETTTTTNRPTGIQPKTESLTEPALVVYSTTEAAKTSGITSSRAVETTTATIRPTGTQSKPGSQTESGQSQSPLGPQPSPEPELTSNRTVHTPDCSRREAECTRLNCEFGTLHLRHADGCERCHCFSPEIDCKKEKEDCSTMICMYGTETIKRADGSKRCECKRYPCDPSLITCEEGKRCVVVTKLGREHIAECREVINQGECPVNVVSPEQICFPDGDECDDDADCIGVEKCCRRGCVKSCIEPVAVTTAPTTLTPTATVTMPYSTNVTWPEGDKATLRCLYPGKTAPRITWRRGDLPIDVNVGRYRLTSAGALEIVSLYRNDSGVYSCVVGEGHDSDMQQFNLVVKDPEDTPVEIAGNNNAVVTSDLDRPLVIRCLSHGYPVPYVFWLRNNTIVLVNDEVYEIRRNSLLIKSLALETLGQYTCQAFNGYGKAAAWEVLVRAYRPGGFFLEHEYLVDRQNIVTTRNIQPSTTLDITTTTSMTTERSILSTVETSVTIAEGVTETEHSTGGDTLSVPSIQPSGNTNFSEGITLSKDTVSSAVDKTSVTIAERVTETEHSTVDDTLSVPSAQPSRNINFSEGITLSKNTASSAVIATTTAESLLLEECAIFKFGCCYDNNTEALGPDRQGCPCNTTEFGCCPDGASPAQGRDNEGCQGACQNSSHGCCEDNRTPAHGPNYEGCCLLTAFGCCPDNRKAAEGPHLEGCECESTQHGCCPDNVTSAQGPKNEGCACQYTEFGCCPDRHTKSSGPDFEGCSCQTYQFGCCPDGVTIATSPDQQSCRCQYSTHGCCGDEQTAATGQNGAGCDCASSKYGCCLDGQTEATGPEFVGCTDIPENKQAVCILSMDVGSCTNYTLMWFYDLNFGGCSRFWYDGCEGNGNRFGSKEECEDICVQPGPKEACKLPDATGPCESDHMRWYYNTMREQCLPFRYGGCLGNANNFETRELCQTQCEPEIITDTCNLIIDYGRCAGNYSRWGYNSDSQRCEQFTWGGCEGNSNRYINEYACKTRCSGLSVVCAEQQEAGNCSEKEALWSFSQTENRCVPFYYTGCGGNRNRFDSKEICEQICPSVYVPDKCTLPATTGDCSEYREKWFYDTRIQRCRQFYYGGCGGNQNNFDSEIECSNACSEPITTTTTLKPTLPTQPTPQTAPPVPPPEPDRESFCFLAIDSGSICSLASVETRYAYDSRLGKCITFTHNGCGGNQNNFPNEEFCTYYCHPVQDVCSLPPDQGDCNAYVEKWYYDYNHGVCSEFVYGGCGGNDNRYDTRQECEARCGNAVATTTTTAASIVEVQLECKTPKSLHPCGNNLTVFYYDSNIAKCLPSEFGNCRHPNAYRSEEECERQCGAFRGRDICLERLDPGPCRNPVMKYYFDSTTGTCQLFTYGGCAGGPNRFSTVEECEELCGDSGPDPEETPVGIAGDDNAVITGDLDRPLVIRCLSHGYPVPYVFWLRNNTIVLVNDEVYEIRRNSLLIRNLALETLGEYTCQAFNGYGKAAAWKVLVRAYRPDGFFLEHEYLVERQNIVTTRNQPSTTLDNTATTSMATERSILSTEETSVTRVHTVPETGDSTGGEMLSVTKENTNFSEGITISKAITSILKFGCCYDNKTEALGPDRQGCLCNTTEFGCCPDSASPAQGKDNEGCQGACKNSSHGCCEDNRTPAHGPNYEGCCLLTAFGCCPDNRKAAEGPHFEGCECESTQHGCCPDNVTAAQGPKNEGCGCLYTEFGCCPDRYTKSSGPEFAGCSCQTYQFGCCPDGVTIAASPEQRNCRCQSAFGCCSDEQTAATGPNGAGCACASSKYGCCLDGQTEAQGSNFLECIDVPENKQAVCNLPADAGPCRNFEPSIMWFYDLSYGGCSRFWYRGCGGNGNRFISREDCEDVCIQPGPKEACKLPHVKGSCESDIERWYFNTTSEQCLPFIYGGCLGNANNFDTMELCQTQCEPDRTTEICNLPIEQGRCAGNYSRWGYNSDSQSCEQFAWSGCEGNSNRFISEYACKTRCSGHSACCTDIGCEYPAVCSEQQEAGNCLEKETLWSFSQTENRCVPFYYTGCGGNRNRFDSRETCEQFCPSFYVPDKCTLPAVRGDCSKYRVKWYFNTWLQRCRRFYYGGCGGNLNNFNSEIECLNACSESIYTTIVSPTQPQRQTTPQPPPDICQLPMLSGPCRGSLMRWFYDPISDTCSQFTYGGCLGNDNRFESREACESRCRTEASFESVTQRLAVTIKPTNFSTTTEDYDYTEQIPKQCTISSVLEECSQSVGTVWYYDPREPSCVSHVNQESGRNCRHIGTFGSKEACERECGLFIGIDVCKQRLNPGPCQEFVTKVYFDSDTHTCKQFEYSGCMGGANQFSSIEECIDVCLPGTVTQVTTSNSTNVTSPEGDKATLQCLYPGKAPFKITWRRGDLIIDVNVSRYRLTSAGALEIVSLYRNDSGVYSCAVSDGHYSHLQQFNLVVKDGDVLYAPHSHLVSSLNHFATLRLGGGIVSLGDTIEEGKESKIVCERHFEVIFVASFITDPESTTVGIAGDENTVITGELGRPLMIRCLAYGYPVPYVFWTRHNMVPFNDKVYEIRGHLLIITSLANETLGEYICKAYNGYGKPTTWVVRVRAYGPDGSFIEYKNFEERQNMSTIRNTQPPSTLETTTTTSTTRTTTASTTAEREISTVAILNSMNITWTEGEKATLQCLYPGKTSTRITWRRGDMIIDVNVGRYRLTSVGALEIASLYRNDSGVYSCAVGDGRDSVTQHFYLVVKDPEHSTVGIAGDENTVIAGELGSPLMIRCLAYGYPVPGVFWTRYNRMVPFNNEVYEIIGHTLIIRSLANETLGQYICKAYNGHEKPALWAVKVRAYGPDGSFIDNENLEEHQNFSTIGDTQPANTFETTNTTITTSTTTTSTTAEGHILSTMTVSNSMNLTWPEGDKATLRCQYPSKSSPRITWRRGDLTIDVNVGRYRQTSAGALEIVSLYRNDSGVYSCMVGEGQHSDTQHFNLVIKDPEGTPAVIAGDEGAVIVGELGKPLEIRCLAYGYPFPAVFWSQNNNMVPFHNKLYEIKENTLLIRSLAIETLGQYTCHAYNGVGKAASWVVLVDDNSFLEHGNLGERQNSSKIEDIQLSTILETTTTSSTTSTTTTSTTTEIPIFFTVPVNVHLSPSYSLLNIGETLKLVCEVHGYPIPDVYWTKDGRNLTSSENILISDFLWERRLQARDVMVSNTGVYGCHAANDYSSHFGYAEVVVTQNGNLEKRQNISTIKDIQLSTTLDTTTTSSTTSTTTTSTTTERPTLTVPVNVHLSPSYSLLNIGETLKLVCEVHGYPIPDVYWTKDGRNLTSSENILISDFLWERRLQVRDVMVSNTGVYGCHAANDYSSHFGYAEVVVTQILVSTKVPATCTDNPFFAKCDLIVRKYLCNKKYYSKFCCKSCVEAGQLDPQVAEVQADQSLRRHY